jgi:hypothetical protein
MVRKLAHNTLSLYNIGSTIAHNGLMVRKLGYKTLTGREVSRNGLMDPKLPSLFKNKNYKPNSIRSFSIFSNWKDINGEGDINNNNNNNDKKLKMLGSKGENVSIFAELYNIVDKANYTINEDTQTKIEESLIRGFDSSNLSTGFIIHGINTNILGTELSKYIMSIIPDLDASLKLLRAAIRYDFNKTKSVAFKPMYSFACEILDTVPLGFVLSPLSRWDV